MAQVTQERKLQNFWKLASVCKEPEDKINFYDLYQEAFEITLDSQKELHKAREYFESEWDIDLAEYEGMHADCPNEFKVLAFDCCILNGSSYIKMKDTFGFYY